MGSLTVTTTLQARGPAAAVVLDDDQVATLGEGKKAFPVRATINGETWQGRVTRMGGEFLLGLNKAIRTQVGAEAGDEVVVEIALDDGPREIEVPELLARALRNDAAAQTQFDALAPSHRKEYGRWIAEAKKPETAARRVEQALEKIRAGQPRN